MPHYNKNHVYSLDASYKKTSCPLTKILTANLAMCYPPNDTYNIDEVFIRYIDSQTDLYITQKKAWFCLQT